MNKKIMISCIIIVFIMFIIIFITKCNTNKSNNTSNIKSNIVTSNSNYISNSNEIISNSNVESNIIVSNDNSESNSNIKSNTKSNIVISNSNKSNVIKKNNSNSNKISNKVSNIIISNSTSNSNSNIEYICPEGYKKNGTKCSITMEPRKGCPDHLTEAGDGTHYGCIVLSAGEMADGDVCPDNTIRIRVEPLFGSSYHYECFQIYERIDICYDDFELVNGMCVNEIDATKK